MWKMMTLSFLMCIFIAILIRVQGAADADAACTACTDTYTSGADCAKLKTYLDCLENAAGTKDGCTLSPKDTKAITDLTCTTLESPCTCQKDFWVKDLSGKKECEALKTYIGCLNKEAAKETCVSGTLASTLVAKPKGRLDSKCSTTPTTAATTTGNKGSGASSLGLYRTIASFLPFVLTAFRL